MFFICRIYSLCITSKSVALAPSLMKSYLKMDKIASSFCILEVAILLVWKEVQSRKPAKHGASRLGRTFRGFPIFSACYWGSFASTLGLLARNWVETANLCKKNSYKMDQFPVEKGSPPKRGRVTMTGTFVVVIYIYIFFFFMECDYFPWFDALYYWPPSLGWWLPRWATHRTCLLKIYHTKYIYCTVDLILLLCCECIAVSIITCIKGHTHTLGTISCNLMCLHFCLAGFTDLNSHSLRIAFVLAKTSKICQ